MRVLGFGLLILSVLALNAYATPFLGSGWNFSVLGATTVTNTGATTLNADLGVCCGGTAVTGSGTITFTGAPPNNVIASTPDAANGQLEATNAVTAIDALSPNGSFATGILTGQTVNAGGANTVIDVGATAFNIATGGVLTLNFTGSNENIIFVMSSTLITGSGSSVVVNGADSTDNVFWVVDSSATLGTTTSFVGNIIASTAVTLDTGATIGCGSVVAQTAAVTMDHNTISNLCSFGSGGTVTPTPTGPGTTIPVQEGGSTLLFLGFLLAPIGAIRAFRRRTV